MSNISHMRNLTSLYTEESQESPRHQRFQSQSTIKRDFRILRSKVLRVLNEKFLNPPTKKLQLPWQRQTEIIPKRVEKKDSYKRIHAIEESFKKVRASELEKGLVSNRSLSIAMPKYYDNQYTPTARTSRNVQETLYDKEKAYDKPLPDIEKLCKYLHPDEIEHICRDPLYFLGVDDYRNFDILSNLKQWAKKDRVRPLEDDEDPIDYKALAMQPLTQRENSLETSGGLSPLSPFATANKTPIRSFKLVFKKDVPVDPEIKKDQQLLRTVEFLKAERKRRLDRFNNQKKAESYREAERIGRFYKKIDVKMKKIETIAETLEEAYKQSVLASQKKLDAMHVSLEEKRRKYNENLNIKRVNYEIEKSLIEKTVKRNQELHLNVKIEKAHFRSASTARRSSPSHHFK